MENKLTPLLVIRGPQGAGKTYLMAAILNDHGDDYEKEGKTVCYMTEKEFHEKTLSSNYRNLVELCDKYDFLMLDDFNLDDLTHEKADNIYTLVDRRYGNRIDFRTIFSTRLSSEEINSKISKFDRHLADKVLNRFKRCEEIVLQKRDNLVKLAH